MIYTITAGTSSPAEFQVNASGELLVGEHTPDQEILNFEDTTSYSLTVKVTDGGGLTDTATILINLKDVEDPPGSTVCEEFDSNGVSLDVLPSYLAPLKTFYSFTEVTPCHRVVGTTDDYFMDQDKMLVTTFPIPTPADTDTTNYRASLGDIPRSWDEDSSVMYFTLRQTFTGLLSTAGFIDQMGTNVTTGEFVFNPPDGTNATDDGVDNFVYRVCDDPVDESEAHCASGVVYVDISKTPSSSVSNDNLIADEEDLAHGPLELPVPAIPNVFVLLDDSVSMSSDILSAESEGYYAVGAQTKTYFLPEDGSGKPQYADSEANNPGRGLWRLRNAEFNKVYYNPAVTYFPWIGLDNRGDEFVSADPTSAISNPYKTNSARINLTVTQNMPNRDRNVYLAKHYTWNDINNPMACPGNVQTEYYNPVTSMFEAQPITTQPVVVNHPIVNDGANCYTYNENEHRVEKLCGGYIVVFTTGSYVFDGDDVSEDIQSIYGVWDTLGSKLVTKSDLIEQTYTAVFNDAHVGDTRIISQNPVNYPTDAGWYLDFDHAGRLANLPQYPGEKAIRNLQVRGGIVFVNSVMPKQVTSCSFETGGAVNAFYPANGSLTCLSGDAIFDINNDGVFSSLDMTSSGEIVASTFFEDAVPTDSSFTGDNRVTQLSDKSLEIRKTNTSGGDTGRKSWVRLKTGGE